MQNIELKRRNLKNRLTDDDARIIEELHSINKCVIKNNGNAISILDKEELLKIKLNNNKPLAYTCTTPLKYVVIDKLSNSTKRRIIALITNNFRIFRKLALNDINHYLYHNRYMLLFYFSKYWHKDYKELRLHYQVIEIDSWGINNDYSTHNTYCLAWHLT